MDVHTSGGTPSDSSEAEGGFESHQPAAPPHGESTLLRSGRSVTGVAKDAWPLLLTLIAGLTSLLTLLGLFYDQFPALRPVVPPEVRRVEILNATLVERARAVPDRDGDLAHVVFLDAEAVGYDAEHVRVGTLWIDAQTLQRTEPVVQEHAVWTTYTRTDRVVGWLDVAYPPRTPPGSSGCMFVRVFLYPTQEGDVTRADDWLPFMLAYADTSPIDPFNLNGSACVDVASTVTKEVEAGHHVRSEPARALAGRR